jgi:hypothetical protein
MMTLFLSFSVQLTDKKAYAKQVDETCDYASMKAEMTLALRMELLMNGLISIFLG